MSDTGATIRFVEDEFGTRIRNRVELVESEEHGRVFAETPYASREFENREKALEVVREKMNELIGEQEVEAEVSMSDDWEMDVASLMVAIDGDIVSV